jgi:hypothetical protein
LKFCEAVGIKGFGDALHPQTTLTELQKMQWRGAFACPQASRHVGSAGFQAKTSSLLKNHDDLTTNTLREYS